jgi:hypothetical protein
MINHNELTMIRLNLCLILILGVITSCTNKVDGVILDEEIAPYFEIFEQEAAIRGVIFNNEVEQIEGYLQNITDGGVIGACRRNDGDGINRSVFFDKPYWSTATSLEKEYVVFHELGHCFLELDHDDRQNAKGECISIMASGTGSCRDNYNEITRDSLLNELFSK